MVKSSRERCVGEHRIGLFLLGFSWYVSVDDVIFRFENTDSGYRTALRFYNKAELYEEVFDVEGNKDTN